MKAGFWAAILLPIVSLAAENRAPADAAGVAKELRSLAIDPAQVYRVRDLQLARGDLKIYLTEGILAFTAPVSGKCIAAVFTTANTEGGDAEVIALPPQRSERASLAGFIKSPNLDQHFASAILFFADNSADELMAQIRERPIRSAPEFGAQLAALANPVLREDASEIDVRLIEGMLDNHQPAHGFFYGMIGGGVLGTFDVVYEPDKFEPVSIGQVTHGQANGQAAPLEMPDRFQIWTSFTPRRPAAVPGAAGIREYRIDTEIRRDLRMSSVARLGYSGTTENGRVIALNLAARLRVTGATVDGKAAETYQHESARNVNAKGAGTFLVVADAPLEAGTPHQVDVRYEGSVIRQTGSGSYFVDERNSWYPFVNPTLAIFDLTFHCPENLRLVATGELVSEDVAGGVRTVHRKTQIAEPLAGFNLGEYSVSSEDHGGYHIEFYSDKSALGVPDLPAQTAAILDYFSSRWMPLPIRSLAVSPIEGYFGQGFPGLIYLSNVSYIRQEDRPNALRNPRFDAFFSEMLLPHEIAHQWWGNIVSQADYRSAWLLEAMSNYSALQFLEKTKGRAALDSILAYYQEELLGAYGKGEESAGPVDFGQRLIDNSGTSAWHLIMYEKGAWILHMLRLRLGDEAFQRLQRTILREYASKPISNEDFRKLAAEAAPETQRDKSLSVFFDSWVYATGIPRLGLRARGRVVELTMGGVDEDFVIDVPLRCREASGREFTHWARASSGENAIELPSSAISCGMPAMADYLYQPGK